MSLKHVRSTSQKEREKEKTYLAVMADRKGDDDDEVGRERQERKRNEMAEDDLLFLETKINQKQPKGEKETNKT